MIFEWKHGLIWIPFKIKYEGSMIAIDNCILDTGSATTAIDIELVSFNYQKPTTIKRLFGIGGGTQEVVAQKVDKVVIGHVELEDIEIEFGDINADLGVKGFIGNDILSKFTITIDYALKKISFQN